MGKKLTVTEQNLSTIMCPTRAAANRVRKGMHKLISCGIGSFSRYGSVAEFRRI